MAGEFLELTLRGDPMLRVRVTNAIQSAIGESFQQDKSRMTMREVARRFSILEDSFRELRTEHSWAIDRILAAFPMILRCKLDGVDWDPRFARSTWAAPKTPV